MPLEIEAKMKLTDSEALRQRLIAAGAKDLGQHLETNTLFDTPGTDLRRADSALRIRINHNLATNETEFIVTFKGPRQPGPLKSRPETEFTVSDPKLAAQLFEALGYRESISFQKRRHSWKLADCKVELDEIPHLGHFVEIEGPSQEQVLSLRQTLGLAGEPMISKSYMALLSDYLEKQKITPRRVEFSAK